MLVLLALPFVGTDFGKGAVRWVSLGFTSVQPSEFLKPALVVTTAWMLAAALEPNGPPGKLMSLAVTGAAVGLFKRLDRYAINRRNAQLRQGGRCLTPAKLSGACPVWAYRLCQLPEKLTCGGKISVLDSG
jgi:hypothetical protein